MSQALENKLNNRCVARLYALFINDSKVKVSDTTLPDCVTQAGKMNKVGKLST